MSIVFFRKHAAALVATSDLLSFSFSAAAADTQWKKHIVHQGPKALQQLQEISLKTAIPTSSPMPEKKPPLCWADVKEVVLDATKGHDFIHSEAFDVDGDGDLDYIAARYQPGLIVWLEQPAQPLTEPWPLRVASRELNGIHGLLKGDVDRDGKMDLIANSAQPVDTAFPESILWLSAPADPRSGAPWKAHAFAQKDAPGLSHYMGFGDVNGDGRPDIATGAKGESSPLGNYFAWWEAPANPTQPWKKHVIAEKQIGATNIHPGDANKDGHVDFIASRGHGQGVVWFEAPAWREHSIHPSLKEPHCLTVLDMDADGDLDAATCGYGDKEVWWFENNGKGTFTNHLVARDQESYDIRATDLDRDGDIDLLIAGRGSNNVTWYANPAK